MFSNRRRGDQVKTSYLSLLVHVKVQKHHDGGRAHPDGSFGLGWSSKHGKYLGCKVYHPKVYEPKVYEPKVYEPEGIRTKVYDLKI